MMREFVFSDFSSKTMGNSLMRVVVEEIISKLGFSKNVVHCREKFSLNLYLNMWDFEVFEIFRMRFLGNKIF